MSCCCAKQTPLKQTQRKRGDSPPGHKTARLALIQLTSPLSEYRRCQPLDRDLRVYVWVSRGETTLFRSTGQERAPWGGLDQDLPTSVKPVFYVVGDRYSKEKTTTGKLDYDIQQRSLRLLTGCLTLSTTTTTKTAVNKITHNTNDGLTIRSK